MGCLRGNPSHDAAIAAGIGQVHRNRTLPLVSAPLTPGETLLRRPTVSIDISPKFVDVATPGYREVVNDVYWLQECLVRIPATGADSDARSESARPNRQNGERHGCDNAYLIGGTESLLFDTFSPASTAAVLDYLNSILDGDGLDYLVASRPEHNHAGNAGAILEAHPGATLVVPAAGVDHSLFHLDIVDGVRYVSPGDAIDLGS
jgi:hypothetical protein